MGELLPKQPISCLAYLHFRFRPLFILSFLFLLSLSGCKTSDHKNEEHSYPITFAEAQQRDVPIFIESIGNVFSLLTVELRPQVGGIITEAFVQQGKYVKKGDPLYQIDPRPYKDQFEISKATLAKDKAALKFAEIRVERYSDLVKKDYFSKLNFDQYTTEVDSAKAQVSIDEASMALAELNLEWSTITSPIDGKIGQFNIDPGNLVVVNDPTALAVIRQITPAGIRFNITQKDFVAVQQVKANGTLTFEAILPQKVNEPRKGEIYFIDNQLSLSTGTILIKGTVDNEDELFWPGEFIRVRLNLGMHPNATLIPEESIQVGQDGSYVYIYLPETGRVEYRQIVKGEKIEGMVVVEKGVKPSEKVVTKGQVNLRPGSKVFVAKENS